MPFTAAAAARHASPIDVSPSPPPRLSAQQQPPTKRDVRRHRILDRLQTMLASFDAHQHSHYRAQLHAVQADMTLVLRADPYEHGPIADGGDDVRELVAGMLGPGGLEGLGDDEGAQRDYRAMAGKRYAEWVREVNDELERRDAELVALNHNYHSALAALQRQTEAKLHTADEEHKALSSTIRQRLVTSITKKRQHLMRDKEQLDIADSNALLLHPNHFSINNNPSSPGGPGQNRKTRHLRHHRAPSPSAGDLGGNEPNAFKRKRKAGVLDGMEDGNESPAPGFRPLPPPDNLGGGRSPFKDARERNGYTQYEAPAYSLERLFTEKELSMATTTAQRASWRYFHTPQQQQKPAEEQQTNSNGTATSVPSVADGEVLPDAPPPIDGEEAAAHPTTENAATGAATPPAAAPEMERQTSHQVLTRGARAANPLAALSDLATAAAASATANPVRENPFAPVIPSFHAITRSEKSGAPAPSGVGAWELENDFEMFRQGQEEDDGDGMGGGGGREMRATLLDQALGIPVVSQPYRVPLLDAGAASVGRGVERPSWTGFAQVSTYNEQKLRQAAAGLTGLGGERGLGGAGVAGSSSMAAALQGRLGAVGGEAMSRTTSAGGSDGGATEPVAGSGKRGGRGRVV